MTPLSLGQMQLQHTTVVKAANKARHTTGLLTDVQKTGERIHDCDAAVIYKCC